MDSNGTLRAQVPFDFESNATSYTLNVVAQDEFNATVENLITVNVINVVEDTDLDGIEDAHDPDIDGDGLSNVDEELYNSNPYDSNSINRPPYDLNSSTPLLIEENASLGSIVDSLREVIRTTTPP